MNVHVYGPTTFVPFTPTLRHRVEAAIETLVALLDEIDGDENLEPDLAGGYTPRHGEGMEEDDPAEFDDPDEEDHRDEFGDAPEHRWRLARR